MTDALLTWLQLPLSGSSLHAVSPAVSWHGRLMVLSWGMLLPLGVGVARFFKVTPGQDWPRELDNKFWWHSHLGTQGLGVCAALAGVGLIWGQAAGATLLARWHAGLGLAVLMLGLAQVVGGLLRGSKGGPSAPTLRGDHYDMTRRRLWFERIHKGAGYTALVLALATLLLGLAVADAPRWMCLALALWWLALVVAFALLQSRLRGITTYQAIWGPSPAHPGNQPPKINKET